MGADIVTVSTDPKFVHKAWQEHERELAFVKYRMGPIPPAESRGCSVSTTRTPVSRSAARS